MYSGTHILVFLAFCNTYFYDIFVAGLHLFGGLIKKRIFCCYRFACALHTSFLFISNRWQEKLCLFSSSIMWTGNSRYGFWCLPIDILLQRSNAAFFTYMLTGYWTKTRYKRIIKFFWNPHKYHLKTWIKRNYQKCIIMYSLCKLHIKAWIALSKHLDH